MKKLTRIAIVLIAITMFGGCNKITDKAEGTNTSNKVVDLTKEKEEVEKLEHEKNETDVSEDGKINPKWKEVKSSTYLQGCDPFYMVDGDFETAYAEGMQGDGEGEWVQFISPNELEISRMVIVNGNQKSEQDFEKNNRMKKALIEFSGEEKIEVELEDDMNQEIIELENNIITTSIKITILEVYPGTEFDDTYITEIMIFR